MPHRRTLAGRRAGRPDIRARERTDDRRGSCTRHAARVRPRHTARAQRFESPRVSPALPFAAVPPPQQRIPPASDARAWSCVGVVLLGLRRTPWTPGGGEDARTTSEPDCALVL